MRYITETGFGTPSNFLIAAIATLALLAPVAGNAAANSAPKISGTPASSVQAGAKYSFRPSASDANHDRLTFSIRNKPSWIAFDATNGALNGTPKSNQVGLYSGVVVSVSDGKASRSLATFSIRVTQSSANQPPNISGTPTTSTRVGASYNFQPSASDPNGDKITFSINNKPAWASFSTTNGRLSGTPSASQVGTTSNIVIRVSDGKASAALRAFALSVTQISTGSATVSWLPPTQNTNGSALTNLAGYRISYGTSASALNRTVQITNVGLTRYVIDNLPPATWYFGVRAYTSKGAESPLSKLASKTIR